MKLFIMCIFDIFNNLKLRIRATGQSVPKHNHVDQHRGRNANAAVLGHRLGLFQDKQHNGVQYDANHDGMQYHG